MKNSLIIMKSFAIGACILTVFFAGQSAGHIPNNDIKPVLELFSLKWEGLEIPVRKTVSDSIWTLLDRLNCVQQGLSYQECVRCLNSAHVLKLVTDNNDTDTTLTTQENVQRLSVVLLNHVLNFRSACKKVDDNDRPSVCQDYVNCRNSLLANFQAIKIYTKQNVSTTKINRVGIKTAKEEVEESFYDKLVDILEVVLRRVKAVYQPLTFTDCFNAENLLSQLDIRENSTLKDKEVDFERLAILISKNILEGKCIDVGEAVTDFLEYLFNHYGNGSAHTIDKDGLTTILRRLKNEKDDSHDHSHDHDHDHDHDHSHDNDHNHDHSRDHDHSHDNNHDHDHSHDNNHDHDHSHDNNHDHDHDHSHDNNHNHDHDHSHEHDHDNSTSQVGSESKVPHKHRSKRDANETENGHVHSRLTDKCLDVASLMDIFSHAPPKDTIGRAEFLQMCPALVQQAVSGVCKQTTKKERSPMTNMELYGYSTIAVLIISLASLVVVVILPIINKRIYQYVMMSMIGLGFGTMAGDAFLHLIPAGLGLHSHDHDDHDHSHDEIEIPPYLYQQLAVLAAIYGIFLFESLLEMFIGGQSHADGSHGHTHVPQQIPNPLAKKSNPKTDSVIELQASCNNSTLTLDADNPDKNENTNLEPVFKAPALICGLTSLAIVITVADTIHNIGDGLAIGAAYSSSVQSGLSTSIAVLCHELPHEFGDFVILLSTGLSFKKALFINFISALSCFIGLYIGIVFGEDEIARQWMLIVTAGIFLYVALSEMLPELKQNKMGSKYKMFFVKNFGILLGLGLMVVIAIYEEKITI